MVPFDYRVFNVIPANISEHRRDYDRVRIDNNIIKITRNKTGGYNHIYIYKDNCAGADSL